MEILFVSNGTLESTPPHSLIFLLVSMMYNMSSAIESESSSLIAVLIKLYWSWASIKLQNSHKFLDNKGDWCISSDVLFDVKIQLIFASFKSEA